MNTKILVFLFLLCFPTQPSYAAFRLFKPGSRGLRDLRDGVANICQIFDSIKSRFNCSSLLGSAATTSTDDSMPDASLGKQIITLSVGNSTPQSVPLIIDTTLNYTFMLCQPCGESCSTVEPVFNPSQSDTFSNSTCLDGFCSYTYPSDDVTSAGPFVSDYFDISQSSNPIVFGCGENNTGNYGSSLGNFGLGIGEGSFLNQDQIGKFSYCFNSNTSSYGALLFDSNAQLQGTSTGLLQNPLLPEFYYVNFTGVTVGKNDLDISSNAYLAQGDGTGGMLLTTTSPLTYLEESVYSALKEELSKQLSSFSTVDKSSEYGLDLCFASSLEELQAPQLTLHFDGADLQSTSYLVTDSDQNVTCLGARPFQGISILGSWIQLDSHVLYDIANGVVEIQSQVDCSSLIGA